jgi:GTP-binding protein
MDAAEHKKTPPLVAIVGRPNVGKSTLFNRLVGERTSVVYDVPGVTRDRVYAQAQIDDHVIRLVDTGGLDLDNSGPLAKQIRAQTLLAIEEADFVVLVLDGQEGPHPADLEAIELLRRHSKAMQAVVNKIDVEGHEEKVWAFYELGLEHFLTISCEHNRGLGDLVDVIFAHVSAPSAQAMQEAEHLARDVSQDDLEENETSRILWKGGPIHVAVVGRPNVGKSSLINKLLGEERLVAADLPGTTRDAVDTPLTFEGQDYVFIDTAGMRRKRLVQGALEHFATMRSVRSIERADVVLLVVDASAPIAQQEARLAGLITDRGKGVLVILNKWDLVNQEEQDPVEDLKRCIPFATFCTHQRVSAKTGRHVLKILPHIVEIQKERHRRVATGELNRFCNYLAEHHPPPMRHGKRSRLYYVSQPMIGPPTFVFSVSKPQHIPQNYRRYLMNSFRERYGFGGTPIWLKFRDHKKK